MKKPLFKQVNVDNINIQVALWKCSKPKGNILAIHGISSSCMCWNLIAQKISEYYNFYAIDLRGRGHSDKPDKGYYIEKHCEDIKIAIEKLNIKPVILMGHSLGAYIALVFASKHQDYLTKLILFDGGGKLDEKQAKKVFEGIKHSLERLGKVYNSFEEYISYMKQAPFLQPWHKYMDEYYRYEVETFDNGKVKPLVRPETIVEEAENLKNKDISEYYSSIKSPVYIFRATNGMITDDDLLLPEEVVNLMKSKIKNAQIYNISDTNHYSIVFQHNENRDNILLSILEEDNI